MSITAGIRSAIRSGLRSGINPGSTVSLSPTVLTSGVNTAGTPTSQATASISPASNAVIYAAIANAATSAATPTASGNGLTWVAVNNQLIGTARNLTVFRAMGSPSAGAVTFDFAAQAQNSTAWVVVQFAGADTSGTNGSGATVQSVKSVLGATNTTMTNTLAALGSAANAHLAFTLTRASGHTAVNPDADFVELADVNTTLDALCLEAQWALNQTPCTPTWAGADLAAMISVEVKQG